MGRAACAGLVWRDVAVSLALAALDTRTRVCSGELHVGDEDVGAEDRGAAVGDFVEKFSRWVVEDDEWHP